jgi:hypothetical protein
MKKISELLRDADPLANEPMPSSGQRHFRRQAVLAAASSAPAHSGRASHSKMALLGSVALLVLIVAFLGARMWSPSVSNVQAAVRFEVRLAEDNPGPGLREAKMSDSSRPVYLHNKIIVTNSDISAVRVIESGSPSQYSVGVEFTASGAEKMRAATAAHIGKPMAILLDGQVAMAPVIRSPISTFALITGHFTKTQAENLASGIRNP